MNIKAKRKVRFKKVYYCYLYIKLLVLKQHPHKRMSLMQLVVYNNVRKRVKRDIQRYHHVTFATLKRAALLGSAFWPWVLEIIATYKTQPSDLDKVFKFAFQRGRVPHRLKDKVKNLIENTIDLESKRKILRDINKEPIKVYRCCRVNEYKLNNGEFGWWWTPDKTYATLEGIQHSKEEDVLALYSLDLELQADKIVYLISNASKGALGCYCPSEVILFDVTPDTPSLQLECGQPPILRWFT